MKMQNHEVRLILLVAGLLLLALIFVVAYHIPA
jgi:hypothetical protein